ncbi:unnamed protein product [Protopolystoma xenopodis]|uniref:Dynein heavy chain tail domain-containing protein n=1 Tax=Protopolystoma xenopodis TaxID=117903 RepID=A0A448WQN3_9PLAT|nr:unnamed protein product [Protopolystoma xenopodis]
MLPQFREFLDPNELLKGEVEETTDKVHQVLVLIQHIKDTYRNKRENLRIYFEGNKDCPGQPNAYIPWDFPMQLVFSRLDAFYDRVKTINVGLLCERYHF